MHKLLSIFLTLALFQCLSFAQGGPQLYNMSFDEWSKDGSTWYPRPDNATPSKRVWDTGNKGTKIVGKSITVPEEEFVAVKGPGKKAAKLMSQDLKISFAPGGLYTGEFLRLVGMGAALSWGIPFTARPKSLHGYYHYTPQVISSARAPYKDKKGQMDNGRIYVVLADWDDKFIVRTTTDTFIDEIGDGHIIGFASLPITEASPRGQYEEFNLEIEYRSDRTPKYVVIVCSASRWGDYFTGGDGSVLYLDEFSFVY